MIQHNTIQETDMGINGGSFDQSNVESIDDMVMGNIPEHCFVAL